MNRNTIIIIVVVLVLLLGAGGGLAYYFGVLDPVLGTTEETSDSGTPPPPPTGNGTGSGIPPSNQESGQLPVTPTPDLRVDVMIARETIPVGTLIEDVNRFFVADKRMQPDLLGIDYIEPQDIGDLRGKVTNRDIVIDEVVDRAYLDLPGLSQQIPPAEDNLPRKKAYPLEVDRYSGVGGLVRPGDFVDVIVTFRFMGDGIQPNTYRMRSTKTVVQRAQVLRILKIPRPRTDAPPEPGQQQGGSEPSSAAPPPASDAPPAPAEGVPGLAALQAGEQDNVQLGSWFLILAVDNQEAELLEFAESIRGRNYSGQPVPEPDPRARITVVLRGSGDTEFEPTLGTSFDLLISEFGLPLPSQLPGYLE